MVSMFLNRKEDLLVDFFDRGETINAAGYCKTLKKSHIDIQNKYYGKLMTRVSFLHKWYIPILLMQYKSF